MPTKGQILVNPITGDTFEFLETSIDTQGKSVSIKTTLKSKGELVPNHFHLLQDESFTIISGKLNIWLNGENQTLSENETITLPKNKAHNHFNNTDDEVTYVHYVSPALDFEYLIENLVGLASDGKMVNGKSGLIQELVTLKYLDSKAFLANIPVPIQKLLMNTIAPIAKIFGYKAIYKKYSGIEK